MVSVRVNKLYSAFSDELKNIYGCKVQRISVDAEFTCPNRDGTLDTHGCIFCSSSGSGAHGIKRHLSITEQLYDGMEVMRRKYHATKFLAYFQSYSNTYADITRLNELYSEALVVEHVVGLIVGTRPDCLPDEVLDYLAELNRDRYVLLELGMQSMHDKSLLLLNRCHTHSSTAKTIARAHERHLPVCVHVILGIPGESSIDMLAVADEVNRLGVAGVKIHLLHVMKNTRLAELYEEGVVTLFTRDEYITLVCDFLERLNPEIRIHRLTGDGGHDNLLAPLWSLKKFEVLNGIDAEMRARKSYQGVKYSR